MRCDSGSWSPHARAVNNCSFVYLGKVDKDEVGCLRRPEHLVSRSSARLGRRCLAYNYRRFRTESQAIARVSGCGEGLGGDVVGDTAARSYQTYATLSLQMMPGVVMNVIPGATRHARTSWPMKMT